MGKIIGIIVAAILFGMSIALLATVPFFFLWNWAAPIYFTFLPAQWQSLPFWHCVGLVILVSSIKTIALPSVSASKN